jgi:hypothetical protein
MVCVDGAPSIEKAIASGFLIEDVVRVVVRGLPPHATAPDLYVFDQEQLWLRRWDARRRAWTDL